VTSPVAIRGSLREQVAAFYADYAVTIDRKQPNAWVDTFTPVGVYAVTTYNNASGRGMWWYTDRGLTALKERAAYTNGYFWHAPEKTLHMISNIRVRETEDATVAAQAYFAMFTADRGGLSQLHVCGEYDDLLVRVDDGLRFAEHRVIIDSETVPPNMGVLL
jgi:3-phenylpropionate/cinnamic acid dioxygenase small subunit